jgi:hypothetical protein
MFAFARFMLGRNTATAASYDRRTRELVIDRVTAQGDGASVRAATRRVGRSTR